MAKPLASNQEQPDGRTFENDNMATRQQQPQEPALKDTKVGSLYFKTLEETCVCVCAM